MRDVLPGLHHVLHENGDHNSRLYRSKATLTSWARVLTAPSDMSSRPACDFLVGQAIEDQSQNDLILFGKAWTGRISRLIRILENVFRLLFQKHLSSRDLPDHVAQRFSRVVLVENCLWVRTGCMLSPQAGGRFLIRTWSSAAALSGNKRES